MSETKQLFRARIRHVYRKARATHSHEASGEEAVYAQALWDLRARFDGLSTFAVSEIEAHAARRGIDLDGIAALGDVEPLDYETVLSDAVCAWEDNEKAEQGFGPLDIGWTSGSRGDFLSWWITEYGAPAIRAAVANAKGEEG